MSALQHKSFALGNLNVDLRHILSFELGRTTGMFLTWVKNSKLKKLTFSIKKCEKILRIKNSAKTMSVVASIINCTKKTCEILCFESSALEVL